MEKSYFKVIFFILLFSAATSNVNAQGCIGGSQQSVITPTGAFQTATIVSGRYLTFTGSAGSYYTFSFCQGGAVNPGFDAELTLFTLAPNSIYAYSDDVCGGNLPEITWFCTTTGTYNVLLTQYSCTVADVTNKTIAYKIAVPLNDNICSATYLYSNRCAFTYATYNNSFSTTSPQAAPSCGTFSGRDIWFSTKVPSSGRLDVSTLAGGVTNAAIAVYKGTSCTSTLTQVGCSYINSTTMPVLNLTGLNGGDSLYIRFYSFNNLQAGTFGIALRDPAPYYCMAGNSTEINGSRCINITPDKRAQMGAVWNTSQINMAASFDYTYTVNLGNKDGGADGLTFTLQNNAAGLSAVGNPGYQLGIGPLTNTFIIEFDTYDNGPGAGDIAVDHIAIDVNGNVATPVAGAIQASSTSANIEDGLDHTVRITWNPGTTTFTIYFDGVSRLTYTNDILNTVFGGNPLVYWGFTGSTGSFTNTQLICPGNLPGAPTTSLPVSLSHFDVELLNEKATLTWGTHSEENSKEFIVERSTNGNEFSSIGSVLAHGFSNQTVTYQFTDIELAEGVTYYRLKQIDINGNFQYSSIKTINNSHINSLYKIYPNPLAKGMQINIELTEDASVEVYDLANVLQHQQSFTKGKSVLDLNSNNLSAGIYYAVIRSGSSVNYTKIILSH
jgi:hypothetical protein